MKKLLFLLLIGSIAFSNHLFAQEKNKEVLESTEIIQVQDDLDSLLNVWYVKKSMEASKMEAVPDSLIEEVSDSVYIARLNALPMIMEMTYNDKVRRYIEAYVRRGKRSSSAIIGLSKYYFPIFEEILDQYGLPLELKYLPVIESALNPRAVSRAGATGLWQFMYSTGRMYQLEVSSYVDDRRDPIKASYAAARFLRDLYAIYGDWTLVIAAYNCGPGNVNKAIRRAKGQRDYWAIYNYLPKETRGYVPAFIGATYLMNYYSEHGITPVDIDIPLHTDTIMVNQKLHLQQVAEVLNLPIEQLRELNPQYKKDIIPAITTSYSLKLPVTYAMQFVGLEDSIYAYKDTIFFDPKRTVVNPPTYSSSKYYASSSAEPPSTKGKTKLIYTVKSGDVVGSIASWYDVKTSDLKYWNNIRGNMIRVGQHLAVYVPNHKVAKYKNVNKMTASQKNKAVSRTSTARTSSSKSQAYNRNYVYYKIRQGDNLWTIAKKYPGISNMDIMKINNFTDADVRKLRAGQVIKIKKKM